MAYGNDSSSLRGGFFLQKLCLLNILHDNRKVTPERVVQEFNRAPGWNNKHKVAIARFKAECYLRGLPLNGRQVTPEVVVSDYQAAGAILELARFKAECCLKGLMLNGQQVTPDTVVKDFPDSPAGQLGVARFTAECCLKGLTLSGQKVKPDRVVKDFPDTAEGRLGIVRFKEHCCLRGLLLNGQQVAPDAVARGYQAIKAKLELARFKAECCLRNWPLHGRQVTQDAVSRDYQAVRAILEQARFREQCCLRGLPLNGQQVKPDKVMKSFPDNLEGKLGAARFKEKCCLRGLLLSGQQVTPDEVVEAYPDNPEGKLGVARFKEECCLRGLTLNGQQVIPDTVVKDYQAARAILEQARFREECCLSGLLLSGQQVTPDAVVEGYPDSPEGRLGIARFKGKCFLRGLLLSGKQVTSDLVAKGYQAVNATLELARFKKECCLRGLVLNGQQVSPDAVVKGYPDNWEGRLGIARFKAKCCLRGLLLSGQEVTPDAVIRAYPDSREGRLGVARFKAECCLMGLLLNSQRVSPEEVVKDYERGGWLLERAFFYAQLALNASQLNGSCLDDQKVLDAFNDALGDHTLRQVEYLVQRLREPQWFDETSEALDIIKKAWEMSDSVMVNDRQRRLQCILKFMAMRHELTIAHQPVSAEQVLHSINSLRSSFENARVHFFFLAHCYITGQPIDGRAVYRYQVLQCLQDFPEGSKLRHALGCWFEELSAEANIMDELWFKPENAVGPGSEDHAVPATQKKASVVVSREHALSQGPSMDNDTSLAASAAETLKQRSGGPGFVDNRVLRLNALTLKTMGIIQDINGTDGNPPILVTGPYTGFLQNRCSRFDDIDIICTTEVSARTLCEKLQAFNAGNDSEIPKTLTIRSTPGCPAIKRPESYNIQFTEGDLGSKAMGLQVSVDTGVTHGNAARLAVQVPGVEKPVWCLSFAEETRLLNNTLAYLADNLDSLTEQLQKGAVFDLPQTILFNNPGNSEERIYGLFICALQILNKARQFIALHGEGTSDNHPLQAEQQRLHSLTANLQRKLTDHVGCQDFQQSINDWLSITRPYQTRRKDFIKALLSMMHQKLI